MFDGISLECKGTDSKNWHDNGLLSFVGKYSVGTGEVLKRPVVAKHSCLDFKIAPSRKQKGVHHCSIKGSLHKYHSQGLNTGDFTLEDVKEAVKRLKESYQIDPTQAILHGLEVGVNIALSMPVKDFLNGVVSMPSTGFDLMNKECPEMGLVCKRTEYEVKIYDKVKQAHIDNPNTIPVGKMANILRVEVKFTRMRQLTKYGINTLSDLCEGPKVYPLILELEKHWKKLIWLSDSAPVGKLSHSNQLRLERYKNPRYWKGISKQARVKFRRSMDAILNTYEAFKPKNDVWTAIWEKWESLTGNGPKGQICTSPKRDKPQQRKCRTCKRDISHQRKNSVFCSERIYGKIAKRCRNQASNKARKLKREQTRPKAKTGTNQKQKTWTTKAKSTHSYKNSKPNSS